MRVMARQERPRDGTHNHQSAGPASKRHLDQGSHGAWAAAATLAAYWGLTGAGLLLRLANDPALDVPDQLVQRVIWGAWPTIGAVIVARRPRNRIGWLCCAVGLLLGPAFFAQDYAWYALIHRPGSLPGGLAMGWFGNWPWFIALVLILVLCRCCSPTASWCPNAGGRSPGQQQPGSPPSGSRPRSRPGH